MKTKLLSIILAASLLALTAFLVHTPKPAQADEIPEKYRETVQKGLEYLVKHQFEDGHWEGDNGQHPVAMTGLVGIALLMERNIPTDHDSFAPPTPPNAKYATEIRKAADWLIDKSDPGRDGLIFSDHPSETSRYMQGQGLATLFLAGALRVEHDDARRRKLTDFLARAVKYIVKSQSSEGGWYHTSKMEGHDFGDITVTAIQIQALQAAEIAGIPVVRGVIDDAQEYIKRSVAIHEETPRAGHLSRPAEKAAALACRFRPNEFGKSPDIKDKLCSEWLTYCQSQISPSREINLGSEELTHYYFAQASFNLGSDIWSAYRSAFFDQLQNSQRKDGAWPAGQDVGAGEVYSTAVWCTILQLDHRSHPSMIPIIEWTR